MTLFIHCLLRAKMTKHFERKIDWSKIEKNIQQPNEYNNCVSIKILFIWYMRDGIIATISDYGINKWNVSNYHRRHRSYGIHKFLKINRWHKLLLLLSSSFFYSVSFRSPFISLIVYNLNNIDLMNLSIYFCIVFYLVFRWLNSLKPDFVCVYFLCACWHRKSRQIERKQSVISCFARWNSLPSSLRSHHTVYFIYNTSFVCFCFSCAL